MRRVKVANLRTTNFHADEDHVKAPKKASIKTLSGYCLVKILRY